MPGLTRKKRKIGFGALPQKPALDERPYKGAKGARGAARPATKATPRPGQSGGAIRAFGRGASPATGGAPRPPVAPGRTAPQRSKLRRPPTSKPGRKLPTTIGGRGRSRLRFGGR